MKRALIITYYWPPSGGSGVQRWLKMSKYLPQYGWEPVIYTADNAEYPVEDASLAKEVSPNTTVLRLPIVEPYSMYKSFLGIKKNEKVKAGFINEGAKKTAWKERLSIWIRGNLFIPDARCWWIKPSVLFLSKYLKDNKVDVIISTGPPHSMHLIAMELNKKTNIPWVADFRDPWTDIDFYNELKLTHWADRRHHKLEAAVMRNANRVVFVGHHGAKQQSDKHHRQIDIITNGFDFELPKEPQHLTTKFSISHVGIIGSSRNSNAFWDALKELIEENESLRQQIEIRLIGQVDRSVIESVNKRLLSEYVSITPYIEHDEVFPTLAESQVLLLLINNTFSAKSILSGKIFEYMASGRPILALCPTDGDAAAVLKETQTGMTCDFNDKDGIKEALLTLFERFSNNDLHTCFNPQVNAYSRKELTKKYSIILNELTERQTITDN